MQETPTFAMVPLKGNFTHVRVYWLVRTHVQTCVNMCPVMSNGTLASLTYCTSVLHEGLYTCYAAPVDTYVGTYTYATCVSPTCSRESLRRIFSQGAYSLDIISSYSE